MILQSVKFFDAQQNLVATAQVEQENGFYSGFIDLYAMPEDMLHTFAEFESIVNQQIFSLLDHIEAQIQQLKLTARFDDGREISIDDLQIYPSEKTVSFKAAETSDIFKV